MTTETQAMTPAVLKLDAAEAVEQITNSICQSLQKDLRKKGLVLGLSGGIDSSVCAALAIRAVGPERVFGLMMPEHDSEDDSLALGQLIADHYGFDAIVENVAPVLEGAGCYRRRDEAIQTVFPEYGEGWKSKIVLPNLLKEGGYRVFSVVVEDPEGNRQKARLPLAAYQQIVAATNFKQRCRKMLEYYHADRLNFAVIGTPNRLEYDQGFFVKQGDGASDLKPIAHLYKTQVYQLAEYLEVPEVIRMRPPTTDTYSLEQSQDEFYFAVPYHQLDMCMFAKNQGLPAEVAAAATSLTSEQVELVYKDIDAKRKATRYQHLGPQLVEEIFEIKGYGK